MGWAGSSAWYAGRSLAAWAVERPVRMGNISPRVTGRPRVQIPPGPPRLRLVKCEGFLENRLAPPGGREKDSRKEIVSRWKKIVQKREITDSSIRWFCHERNDRDRMLVYDHGTWLMILFLGRASYTGFVSRGSTFLRFLERGPAN